MDLIDRIEDVRSRNNVEWMALLRLAIEARPDEARQILSRIAENDARIRELTEKLSDSSSPTPPN